jgi:hypothetical protein
MIQLNEQYWKQSRFKTIYNYMDSHVTFFYPDIYNDYITILICPESGAYNNALSIALKYGL